MRLFRLPNIEDKFSNDFQAHRDCDPRFPNEVGKGQRSLKPQSKKIMMAV